MTSTPNISLVIPAFNEAAYLPRLLDTVDAAKENYRHGADRIEIIIADNSSTDETPDIGQA
jgi:glycosyltransferase involved in cell wall biosynthesis